MAPAYNHILREELDPFGARRHSFAVRTDENIMGTCPSLACGYPVEALACEAIKFVNIIAIGNRGGRQEVLIPHFAC